MAARNPSRAGIRQNRSYAIAEAARALGVARGTVRRWISDGLPAITDRKPHLILGGELIDFLTAKRRPKVKCEPHQFFCFSCGVPRAAAFREIELKPTNRAAPNLRALCETCSTVMHKRAGGKTLQALREAGFSITPTHAEDHLSQSCEPCLNDHIAKEG